MTLGTPWIWSPPGSFVHGISKARILECVVTSFSREYTQVFCFQLLTHGSLNHQPRGASGKWVLSVSLMVGSVVDALFYSHVDAIKQGVSTYQ